MTILEALDAVESHLAELGLEDRWGGPISGIEAAGVVADHLGQDWDACVDAFEYGLISPGEYVERIRSVIDRFSRQKFSSKLDRLLSDLRANQIELGIGSPKVESRKVVA